MTAVRGGTEESHQAPQPATDPWRRARPNLKPHPGREGQFQGKMDKMELVIPENVNMGNTRLTFVNMELREMNRDNTNYKTVRNAGGYEHNRSSKG